MSGMGTARYPSLLSNIPLPMTRMNPQHLTSPICLLPALSLWAAEKRSS